MKTPKFISKLAAVLTPRPRKKLQATARAVPRAAMDDYDADEPTTKLSSAFVVVLILHVVAVGGIYAFNSIKAARVGQEPPATATEKAKPAATGSAKAPTQTAAAVSPAANRVVDNTPAIAPLPAAAKPGSLRQHGVKAGENPTKIAIAYGLRTDELLAANNLKDGALLQPGQMLTIPAPKPTAKPAETHKAEVAPKQIDVPPTRTTPGLRFVKKGDTATSIAKNYGLTAAELLKFNKITDPTKLQPGRALKIPPKKG